MSSLKERMDAATGGNAMSTRELLETLGAGNASATSKPIGAKVSTETSAYKPSLA